MEGSRRKVENCTGAEAINLESGCALLMIRGFSFLLLGCLLGTPLRGQRAVTPVESIQVAEGFSVERLYSVPRSRQGSWVAMCMDDKGRLITSDQYGSLYRFAPPPAGKLLDPAAIERIDLPLSLIHI